MTSLTYEYLSEILAYDPPTGELRNKVDRGRAKACALHTSENSNGYIHLKIKGTLLLAHRVIWVLQTEEWPECEVDHKNTLRNDNRWENLREATEHENRSNRKVSKANCQGVKGVRQRGKKFLVYIRIGKKFVHLGTYDSVTEASSAYLEAAQMVKGDFARAA